MDPRLLSSKISPFSCKQSKHSQEIIRVSWLRNFMSIYLFFRLSLYGDFGTSYADELISRELPSYTEWHCRWVLSLTGFVLFLYRTRALSLQHDRDFILLHCSTGRARSPCWVKAAVYIPGFSAFRLWKYVPIICWSALNEIASKLSCAIKSLFTWGFLGFFADVYI